MHRLRARGRDRATQITDSEGGRYPLGEIHFVEQNHRGKGVFVAATDGDDNPLSALWVTKLVPAANSPIPGPTGAREGTVHGQRGAHAIVTLPDYRSAARTHPVRRLGERGRFGQHFVWVLGTNPFVLGLPSAQPQSNSRQAATASNPWATHFALDEELNQSVGAGRLPRQLLGSRWRRQECRDEGVAGDAAPADARVRGS